MTELEWGRILAVPILLMVLCLIKIFSLWSEKKELIKVLREIRRITGFISLQKYNYNEVREIQQKCDLFINKHS